MQKCAFFDRDGVINKDLGYVYRVEDFVFCDGLFEILPTLKEQGYILIVITNQSGIARGYYTQAQLEALHSYMQQCIMDRLGFCFDAIYYCPHTAEQNCTCRKPKSGMIKSACRDFHIDLSASFFVGDKITDMQCAQEARIGRKFLLSAHEADKTLENVQNIATLYQLHSIIRQNLL